MLAEHIIRCNDTLEEILKDLCGNLCYTLADCLRALVHVNQDKVIVDVCKKFIILMEDEIEMDLF